MNRTLQANIKIAIATLLLTLVVTTTLISSANAQMFGFGERLSKSNSRDAMKKSRAALAEKLTIATRAGRFVLEFPTYEEAENLGQSIIEKAYSSSNSSNGDNFYLNTESELAQFTINSGTDQWGQKKDDAKTIKLTDIADATNRVEIEMEETNNRLSMLSLDLAQESIHIIRQTNERMTLVSIRGNSFEYMSEKDINELVAKSDFVSTLEGFRNAGFGLPKIASRSKIETLIESILNFSDEDRKTFESTFPNLVSKKFQLRKQEAKKLSQQLGTHLLAVSAMLTSDNLPLEMRARFVEAIKASDDQATVLLINTVVDGKLKESPPILVKLLRHQIKFKASTQFLQNTVDQLEKSTDQKFGDDIEAWSNWVKQSQPQSNPEAPTPKSADQGKKKPAKKTRRRLRKTGREQVQQPLQDLLKLKLNDQGSVVIDRKHWGQSFDNKTPGTLMKEAKQSFEGSGLPKSWLKMGGEYNIAGMGYEQILFQRIADNLKIRSETYNRAADMHTNKTKSLNRTVYKSDLRMTLMVHPQGNRWEDVRKKRVYFKFLFEDEAEDLFYLLSEHPKQGFSIFLFWKDGETVLNLRCDTGGKVQLDHVAEQKQTSLSAPSVQSLLDDNGDFVNKQVLPLLEKIGISADGAFGSTSSSTER